MLINYSILSKSALFARIPKTDLLKAINCLQGYTKIFEPGELINKPFKNSTPGIVLSGSLSLTQIFQDGSTVLIKNINPGELFGIFLTFEGDNTSCITASGKSVVLFLNLPINDEESSCNCIYRMIIMENLVKILIQNNIYLNQKIKIISRYTIREKLLQYFQMLSHAQRSRTIQLNMSREKLAEYICSERSAVSRELNKMDKEGIIKLEKQFITLK